MKPLAEEAIKIVTDGRTQFVPERFTKTYLNWMESVHDWCISRQLWWGHRIPAYYCDVRRDRCFQDHVGHMPEVRAAVKQDPDVLDTWFSSALWPFSTLGWPEKTKRIREVLPHLGFGDGIRYYFLLGCAYDFLKCGAYGAKSRLNTCLSMVLFATNRGVRCKPWQRH